MSGNTSGFCSYNPNTSSSGSGSGSGAGSSGTSSSAWKSNASEIRDVSKSFSSTASSSTDSKVKSYAASEASRWDSMARNADSMANKK
ncbi:hypothetical protein QR685DRAFT_552651 [Neurospora intermedia]|uniref:Uncharacterized protein n=1 Tax=Neurospora intermedia TaxID=5142 RepID=A0ABR3DHM2_NEUIN